MEPLWSPVVATRGNSGNSTGPRNRKNKLNPLPPAATGCLRRSMVRRGSTVRVRQRASCATRLGEALDKRERFVGDLAPTAVDRQRMPAVRDPRDLGDTGVASLLLVRRVDDCPGHRVILLAGYEQQRAAVGTLAVDLRLGPRIEVGARGLK